nr:reverse transcriptase domain-containing protein [Tanacetum cinerariifolium]
MRTRSRSRNNSPQREASLAIVEPLRIELPFLEDQFQEDTPPESPMADNRTMAELLQTPTEGYEDAIIIPEITANNFELKHVPAIFIAHAAVSVPAEPMVHSAESPMDDPLTAPEHGSSEPTVAVPTPSSLRHRHALYQSKDPDTFALLLWGDLHIWRLYPRAQVHVLEMVDGRVIHMFIDVSDPLSVGTLERMLKHVLEVSKLLVGGDLTMAEQLIGFIKAALLNAKSVA